MNPFPLILAALIPAGPLQISPESKELIVEFETGGKYGYDKHPEWPGGASGCTVGIGYDCGYNSRAAILSDWKGLPEGTRNALASTAGVKGIAAKSRTSALKWIIVPWEHAEALFVANTMPRFGNLTANAYRGVLKTNGDIQGVMLSLTFNRGDDKRGERRRELAAMDADLLAKPQRLADLPVQIRSMKRLWVGKGLSGLLRRRDAEARLIENSLTR